MKQESEQEWAQLLPSSYRLICHTVLSAGPGRGCTRCKPGPRLKHLFSTHTIPTSPFFCVKRKVVLTCHISNIPVGQFYVAVQSRWLKPVHLSFLNLSSRVKMGEGKGCGNMISLPGPASLSLGTVHHRPVWHLVRITSHPGQYSMQSLDMTFQNGPVNDMTPHIFRMFWYYMLWMIPKIRFFSQISQPYLNPYWEAPSPGPLNLA